MGPVPALASRGSGRTGPRLSGSQPRLVQPWEGWSGHQPLRAGLPSPAGRRKEPGVRDPSGLRGALVGTRCSVCRLALVVAEAEGQT